MGGLVIQIKLNSYVAHTLYSWPSIYNTVVPSAIKHYQYYFSLDTYTTIFAWGAGNSNEHNIYWIIVVITYIKDRRLF